MAKFSLYLANSMVICLLLGAWFNLIPHLITTLYLFLSGVTFIVYWLDKHKAKNGDWRTPESTLHLFALCGGWPGAIWAQQLLRHKSTKRPFRNVFWLTVIGNLALLTCLFSSFLQPILRGLEKLNLS
ncbi:hypothetical protein PULV_a2801 [Pseudoalteromonas ulvae UL12]|nr:DUF1294 domain-containing protein [Pseudoalteromonas ulvae]MBE0364460.1 hypothetical protein [Pseudoalteromonas ulvae UL12]